MKNRHLTLNYLQVFLSKISCKIIGVLLIGFISLNVTAQSFTQDNVYVHENGESVVFAAHTFDGTNVVETTRTGNKGYFSFESSATWTAAANASHVDGYVTHYRMGDFVFPIGDNGVYRPASVTNGPASAAYYAVNPNGSYPVSSTASDVSNVSTIEYWDVDGTGSNDLTLTWNATSDINTVTGGNLSNLIIVGWDGTQWVKVPSVVNTNSLDASTSNPAFTGAASSLTSGSITASGLMSLSAYEAYTFASEAEVCLTAKAFLQGALYLSSNAIMTDDLRATQSGGVSIIPTSEPYAAMANFTHVGNGGSETTTAGVLGVQANTDNNIVDWVFIELRDATNSATVVETQSALIQRDGDIVAAADGISNVCFSGLASNTVFVAVRHRNHLGVMANAAVTLTPAGTAVDFSTTTLHGTRAAGLGVKSTGAANTVTGLWCGNTNSNTSLIYDNNNSDIDDISTVVQNAPGNGFSSLGFLYVNQYLEEDTNMDGDVSYDNNASDIDPIANTVINHPANGFKTKGFNNITEQLP